MKAQAFIEKFESYCPPALSEAGDFAGLQIGTLERDIEKVMVTLDVRPSVVAEAIAKGVDLIVTKHAPLFRPVQAITSEDIQTQMVLELIKNDIAVYVAHTNMDIINDGLNDWFCEVLQIEADDFLRETHRTALMKLIVYVPTAEAPLLRQAVGAAGAGQQGNYINTSYSMSGTGRFTPVGAARPAIGEVGEAAEVVEERVEVLFPADKQPAVVAAMLAAHPYEEPAYDLITLANQGTAYGLGRIGNLPQPQPIEQLIENIKDALQAQQVRVVFPVNEKATVQRIAICGGSGEKFYRDALGKQADVYITADVYYHTAHDMQSAGLTVVDPGHYMEALCKAKLVEKFQSWQKELDWSVQFMASKTNTDPFSFR